MGKKPSFLRTFLLSVGALALLISLTACPKVKVPKAVRARIPGASGKGTLQVTFRVSPEVNNRNPVKVDLVLVSDKKLLDELKKMSARDWFSPNGAAQILNDYPKEIKTNLPALSRDLSAGQVWPIERVPITLEVVGGVVFANYATEGAHRAIINPRKDLLIMLGEDDLCVQSAKEVAKPCPPPKNRSRNDKPKEPVGNELTK